MARTDRPGDCHCHGTSGHPVAFRVLIGPGGMAGRQTESDRLELSLTGSESLGTFTLEPYTVTGAAQGRDSDSDSRLQT